MPKTKLSTRPYDCVADNIRLLLAVREMSRKEFCRRMDMSQAQLSAWLNHKAIPPTIAIFRAADILHVEPWELVKSASIKIMVGGEAQ